MQPSLLSVSPPSNPSPSLPSLTHPCHRCLQSESSLTCVQCPNSLYCPACDTFIHSHPKFLLHIRLPLPLPTTTTNKLQLDNNQQTRLMESRYNRIALGINQMWDGLVREVESRFEELRDGIEERRGEIVGRMNRRRDRELEGLRVGLGEGADGWKMGEGLVLGQGCRIGDLSARLKAIESQYNRDNTRYQITSNIFHQLKCTLSKLQLKTILFRTPPQPLPPTTKKPMRSSLVFTSPHKSPLLLKSFMSQSTLDFQPKDSAQVQKQEKQDKPEKQEKTLMKVNSQEKAMKMLGKVRSERLFGKSPNFRDGRDKRDGERIMI